MKLKKEHKQESIDLRELYFKLMEENRNVFIEKIGDDIYIFRSISRSEFRKIFLSDEFGDTEKEDIVCDTCVLYPDDFNVEDVDAGIPSVLSKLILKYSYMDSIDTQSKVMYAYRAEMEQLANQIDCIITEAFPKFDVEEVQNWDMDQTLKYLSRAEWILVNLRGLTIESDYFNFKPVTEEIEDIPQNKKEPERKMPAASKKVKEKLTPEKLAELKRTCPEIDWENDSVAKGGIKALEVYEDDLPPALRPGQ